MEKGVYVPDQSRSQYYSPRVWATEGGGKLQQNNSKGDEYAGGCRVKRGAHFLVWVAGREGQYGGR
eukprot:1150542-Pelagomonas_calceolata.AAC.1